MIVVKQNVNDPAGKILLLGKAWVDNQDGTSNLLMPDGRWAFQQAGPNQYGSFGFSPDQRGAYQDAKLNGQLVVWHTRPGVDDPCVYSWAEGPN